MALLNTLGFSDIHKKNSTEYEEKLMTETNVLKAIKNAERFFK